MVIVITRQRDSDEETRFYGRRDSGYFQRVITGLMFDVIAGKMSMRKLGRFMVDSTAPR